MSKDKFIKNVSEIKDQATKMGADAAKTFGKVKGAVQIGLETSKVVINKAGEKVNKKTIGDSLEKAGSGVGIVAKGARVLANTMEGASEKLREAGSKLKKPTKK